ncbi:MAG: glucans biosynthesis glucosyltransferase MdoH [Deltaproteobacteria bacterium]|nr:glucans biosynthesis glucosyltransferase MdoH [Deltaproteobacteria bacterium]
MAQRLICGNWQEAGRVRRWLLVLCILITTGIAVLHMYAILPHHGTTNLERAITIVFGGLFAWISIGFWEAMAGLLSLVRRSDRFAITRALNKEVALRERAVRTAILVPICNEDVARVFAGLRVTYESLEKTGQLEQFDFYVLSDTQNPDAWVDEEIAWAELCESVEGFNRVFYRRRRVNLKRKSGNIADFCRRWGSSYKYMIVFDADSVMAGSSLVALVTMMEQRPKVGIIQTCPMAVNRETLIGRVGQFANHLYGPIFTAGLHFLQLGDSHYWGHNAIIRVAPFIKHCALPKLSGRPPFGGDILSHDFVEAALMRRAGWEIWLAYDLDGSYEEMPPTLLNELKRDRRWCQGNLQHLRMLFGKGIFPAHRALFLHGIMAYGSALLWVLFLGLSTALAITESFRLPDYFPADRVLFPTWPVWHLQWALTLLITTAVILFLPKVSSVAIVIAKQRRARDFGGVMRLLASFVAEVLFATLFSPIRMFFHSKFVLMTLLGRQTSWGSQQRGDRETGWSEALRLHGPGTVVALVWAAVLFVYNRSFFWWNIPVFTPLGLSIPLSVWSSRATIGRALRRRGLFLIPEEVAPAPELLDLGNILRKNEESTVGLPSAWQNGFSRAVVDPRINALHLDLLRHKRKVSEGVARRRQGLGDKALRDGPESLSAAEKRELLYDPAVMRDLHKKVWEITDPRLAGIWGLP